jgi:hypothetical protein
MPEFPTPPAALLGYLFIFTLIAVGWGGERREFQAAGDRDKFVSNCLYATKA